MNKSNTNKPNPISIAKAEDAVFDSIGDILKVTGLVKICTSYNPKDDTFDMTKDNVYKGLTATILRVITNFAQANLDLSEQVTSQSSSRYGSKKATVNPMVAIAKEQRVILEDAGFYEICDTLNDTQQAMYPPRK
tara:strand:- start:1930 stop:2334 length:405 start_codon:yes stop_codon:yes gene_type:complete